MRETGAGPLRLVIDTDTGSDDAVALLLAAAEPGVRIEAVTVVAGNVPRDQGVRNALYTLQLAGRPDVPVHPGCDAPLAGTPHTARHVHGADGMGDLGLPPPATRARDEHAVDVLLDRSAAAPGELTLVTLGPVTNLARALDRDPGVLSRFRRVYLMAGAADGIGNVAPAAEYNVWADPEAMHAVLAARPGNLTFVGWDVSRRHAVLDAADQARLLAIGTPYAAFIHGINRCVGDWARTTTGLAGYDLPDPLAMAVALRPSLATDVGDAHLAVSLHEPTRGMVLVDRRFRPRVPNARVVRAVDGARFRQLLFDLAARGTTAGVALPPSLRGLTGASS